MKGKRALITGGAGAVGSRIATQLMRAEPAEVVVLDNFVRGRPDNLDEAANGPLTLVTGDIGDRRLLGDVMQGIDVVFHQAAIRVTQCAEEPRLALEVMVDGTFNVVEAAVRAGVRRIVAASSAAMYGVAETLPIPEHHHPYNDATLYGAAKLFNEGLLRSYRQTTGLEYVALRYFNVYGPGMDISGMHTEVLIRWMERIAAGQAPLILGDGRQTMDLVYVDDVARANLLAAVTPAVGEVFNVGTGVETSLSQLARTLLRVMGCGLAPEYGPERGVNSVPRRLADTTKACRLLGFEAEVGLEQGLQRLVTWWRDRTGALAAASGAAAN